MATSTSMGSQMRPMIVPRLPNAKPYARPTVRKTGIFPILRLCRRPRAGYAKICIRDHAVAQTEEHDALDDRIHDRDRSNDAHLVKYGTDHFMHVHSLMKCRQVDHR